MQPAVLVTVPLDNAVHDTRLPQGPEPPMTPRFQNRIVYFLWGFAATFLFFVTLMSYVLWRDGAPPPHSPRVMVGVVVLFWSAGLGLLVYAVRQPAIRVDFLPSGRLLVQRRYPLRCERRELARAEVRPAEVLETTDSEGAPYFRVQVALAGGATVDIAEGHSRAHCQAVCARFNAALRGQG